MIITVNNLLPQSSPLTYLSSPTPVGAGTLPVKSLNLFNASWALQLGQTGEAQSEVVLLGTATPAGTIGAILATTQYAHPTDTPVYGIKYDQIVKERSTSGTGGTAIPLSGGTVTIMANGTLTTFDDTSGSTGYAYKTYFRNSALNLTTAESDWITFAGYPMWSLASIRGRIKDKLFNSSYIPNDGVVNNWINEWLEVMTNAAIELNKDYLLGSTQVSFPGTADLGTITATDFKQPRRIWLNQGGTAQYEAQVVDVNMYDPNIVYDATYPVMYMLGDNVLGRVTHTTGATANMLYYALTPILIDDTDQLPVSMRSYSKSFVDYGLAMAKRRDNLPDEATELEASAQAQLTRFKNDMTPRTQTGPIYARLDESIGAQDDYWL